MSSVFSPDTPKDLLDCIKMACGQGEKFEIRGQGSKRGWGRPIHNCRILDLGKLSGISLYEPKELVLSAAAGTTMKSIVETLRDNDQYLAFEPPKLSSLYDGSDKCGTLGGVIATNLSGPRRLSAGAARDHLLGFEAVSGAGEYFKSGGRVVKNVTGFDLSKLLAGSFGTLAAMTSITVKVLPRPNKSRTLLVRGLENKAAIKVLSESLSLSLEVSGAAHLPIGISNKSSIPYISSDNSSVTVIRLEGHAPSVEARCKIVKKIWREYGDIEELHTHNTEKFWNEISGIVTFLDQEANKIWRISVPPSQGAELLVKLKEKLKCDAFFDWGGGLIWLSESNETKYSEKIIREAMSEQSGHATLFRASDKDRESFDVFNPQPNALMNITRKIKKNFDPHGVLNPERMYEGV